MEFDIIAILKAALAGGVATFVYWFLDVPKVDSFLSAIGTLVEAHLGLSKRIVKYAAGATVSVLACFAARAMLIWLGEGAWPVDKVEWLNTIGRYALVWMTAQAAHALTYPKS